MYSDKMKILYDKNTIINLFYLSKSKYIEQVLNIERRGNAKKKTTLKVEKPLKFCDHIFADTFSELLEKNKYIFFQCTSLRFYIQPSEYKILMCFPLKTYCPTY